MILKVRVKFIENIFSNWIIVIVITNCFGDFDNVPLKVLMRVSSFDKKKAVTQFGNVVYCFMNVHNDVFIHMHLLFVVLPKCLGGQEERYDQSLFHKKGRDDSAKDFDNIIKPKKLYTVAVQCIKLGCKARGGISIKDTVLGVRFPVYIARRFPVK